MANRISDIAERKDKGGSGRARIRDLTEGTGVREVGVKEGAMPDITSLLAADIYINKKGASKEYRRLEAWDIRQPTSDPQLRFFLGPPPSLSPGDRQGAKRHVDRINTALSAESTETGFGYWSTQQYRRLKIMKKKWERRVAGLDESYNAHGTRFGVVREGNRKDMAGRTALIVVNVIEEIRETIKESEKKGGETAAGYDKEDMDSEA